MNQHGLILFFLQIGVMLGIALIFGQGMRRFRFPAVLGELAGGIVLGPTVFGALAPQAYTWLFLSDDQVSSSREAVIKIGMLFFLFAAGLEVNLSHLRQRGLSVGLTSLLGILVPFGLGFGSALLLPGLWAVQTHDKALIFAAFVGAALSISALPVIARILMDLSLVREEIGMVVMTAATITDLIGWSLFAVILSAFVPAGDARSIWSTLGLVLVFTVLVLGIGRWIGRPLLLWLRSSIAWPSGFIGITAILVLVAAALAEAIGIHAIFGAFLVGVALSRGLEKEENSAHDIIYQFAISFFAPLYFVSIGLQADFAANLDVSLAILLLLIACVGKVAGAGLGAWLGGMTRREALAIGFGMNARGAMEMILASVALEYRLIDERIFVALIIMALVTSMLSAPLMQRLMKRDVPLTRAQISSL
jgi:Kef-type K+ transport system membrane component KefB